MNRKPTISLGVTPPLLSVLLLLSACSLLPGQSTSSGISKPTTPILTNSTTPRTDKPTQPINQRNQRKTGPLERSLTNQRQDVLMYTMGLLGTGYRFGGKNPEAGLDCSGMVSFIYREATNYPLRGNAASMAKEGRPVSLREVLPGDLVFFNTRGFSNSHVGIFIGEGRFVHAPSTNNKIRVDRLDTGYFAKRFEAARTYFD